MVSSRSKRPARTAASRLRASFDLNCTNCGAAAPTTRLGVPQPCPNCRAPIGVPSQLDQVLTRWYEPRRWRADLVRPSVPYLVERLWTADGQGERLYQGVSPKHANFDVFRHLVTRLIIQGLDEGWALLSFPPDPLSEDPRYELTIQDSERFARGVERLFPEVDWDEPVQEAAQGVPTKGR